MPTVKQAQSLVRLGFSYAEFYGWTAGYAGKVLREEWAKRRPARKGAKK